jgi:hypothetical protein
MSASRGQGTPLPDFLQCEGEWIVEGHLYLYYSDTTQVLDGAAPRFTVSAQRHDEQPCIGFDAEQLAVALTTDKDVIIAANRNRTLIYLGVADVPPVHGGHSATAYGFRLGDKEGYLTVEHDYREGTA